MEQRLQVVDGLRSVLCAGWDATLLGNLVFCRPRLIDSGIMLEPRS